MSFQTAISPRRVLRSLLCVMLLGSAFCGPASAGLRKLLFSRSPEVSKAHKGLGSWRLVVETDAFTGEKTCRLADLRHHISYASGALGFHFGDHRRTAGAWVRIDNGMPVRSRDDLPELARLGVPMETSDLDNPSDGIVWVPAHSLEGADHVAIQPGAGQAPTTFHLKGFKELRDTAREMGCLPEQRFVQ